MVKLDANLQVEHEATAVDDVFELSDFLQDTFGEEPEPESDQKEQTTVEKVEKQRVVHQIAKPKQIYRQQLFQPIYKPGYQSIAKVAAVKTPAAEQPMENRPSAPKEPMHITQERSVPLEDDMDDLIAAAESLSNKAKKMRLEHIDLDLASQGQDSADTDVPPAHIFAPGSILVKEPVTKAKEQPEVASLHKDTLNLLSAWDKVPKKEDVDSSDLEHETDAQDDILYLDEQMFCQTLSIRVFKRRIRIC